MVLKHIRSILNSLQMDLFLNFQDYWTFLLEQGSLMLQNLFFIFFILYFESCELMKPRCKQSNT